jgi:2,4-dienoyl-CoA reductase-like NADH-dependent reductase (Old Yellow Enzyme family)/thioredoxin reductase
MTGNKHAYIKEREILFMQKFPHLFAPIKIAGHTYKNRILCAPMLFGFYALDEGCAERVYKIIEDRAKGGVAEVVVGETPVNFEDAVGIHMKTDIDYTVKKGPVFEAYKKYADIIKKHDAIANIELFHGGIMAAMPSIGTGKHPWGPVGYVREDGVIVDAFDAEKMQKVRRDFANCADFMKAAGFDGILIHGAHGYMFTQFLNPFINRRTDEYGGSIENRGRFPREILKSIREKVGPNFIIEFRVNGADIVEGGTTNEEVAEFCSTLDGLVDIIHISVGFHRDSYRTHTFSSHYEPHGLNVKYAANIKKRTSIPVTVVGGINDPEFAERVIAEGKVDFVSLGRQLIADPEFANKARSGREDEIRRCLRCYHCYPSLLTPPKAVNRTRSTPTTRLSMALDGVENCTINPRANMEVEIDNMPAPQGSRKVLVVGGGPAGMQAAITAFDRGHKVTMLEKADSLGGVLRVIQTDALKVDLKNFKDFLAREVNRRDIRVLLSTVATPEFISEFKPDVVILAIGASPCKPAVPGLDMAIHVLDAYEKDSKLGKKVIMVGGGPAGCETALYLADKGHEVTVVEMLSNLASGIGEMAQAATIHEMDKRNIVAKMEVKCVEITAQGVKVENTSGQVEIIEGDAVVYSLGMAAKRAETELLRAASGEAIVFEVGDCVRGAKVFEAVNEGFMAAMKVV